VVAALPPYAFRFGDGFLTIASEHRPFVERFNRLFASCLEQPTASSAVIVDCSVAVPPPGDVSRIELDGRREWARAAAARDLFADRGWSHSVSGTGNALRWSLHDVARSVTLEEAHGALIARNDEPWEWIVGNLALHRVLMLQAELAVFHAASVAVDGCGVMIVGPKGAGKTTLSLTLAARGHAFLGDETAAVRLPSRELVPFRRSVSLRTGPASRRVTDAISAAQLPPEQFPDGSVRTRVAIERLFPGNVAQPVPLGAVVFLGPTGATARLEEVSPSRNLLARLGVLRSTLWDVPPAVRVMRLAGMLRATRCLLLQQGDPDSTADVLEHGVLSSCH
jgi:hypothetical protein